MKRIVFQLLIIFLVSSACSKEKRVANYFSKGDGTWDIQLQTFQQYDLMNGELTRDDRYENLGTMDFSDNGTMYWKSPYEDGDIAVYGGTWLNSEDELILALEGDESSLAFKITEKKRNTVTLTWEENDSYNRIVCTVQLKRK